MAMHSGDKANQTANLQCAGCEEMVHIEKGQTIPKCDCGSTTFLPQGQSTSQKPSGQSSSSQQKFKKTG